jgi:hypothetical protein
MNISVKKASCFTLRKEKLLKLKLKAIRCGVWFRALSRIDRVLVDLTIKVADRVRSFTLAKILFSVVRKLEDAFEGRVFRVLRDVGLPLARKLSLFAQNWGNSFAKNWASDTSFARFLAIMHLNNPGVFKP